MWAVGNTVLNAGSTRQTLIRHAPGSTTGNVIGNAPSAASLVSWTGPTSGSVGVNSLGDYEILELPAGQYQFIVTAESCPPQTRPVTVTAGQTARVNFPSC